LSAQTPFYGIWGRISLFWLAPEYLALIYGYTREVQIVTGNRWRIPSKMRRCIPHRIWE
jgi:hypothetical protein